METLLWFDCSPRRRGSNAGKGSARRRTRAGPSTIERLKVSTDKDIISHDASKDNSHVSFSFQFRDILAPTGKRLTLLSMRL